LWIVARRPTGWISDRLDFRQRCLCELLAPAKRSRSIRRFDVSRTPSAKIGAFRFLASIMASGYRGLGEYVQTVASSELDVCRRCVVGLANCRRRNDALGVAITNLRSRIGAALNGPAWQASLPDRCRAILPYRWTCQFRARIGCAGFLGIAPQETLSGSMRDRKSRAQARIMRLFSKNCENWRTEWWSGLDSNSRYRFLNWQMRAFRRRLQHSDGVPDRPTSGVSENRATRLTVFRAPAAGWWLRQRRLDLAERLIKLRNPYL
jgi:hypothetical protein